MLETAVQDLKLLISEHDGTNVANRRFSRRVDELIHVFYDDIGEITMVPTHTLFDLFVIKVLYVERSSTDAAVVDYLGHLLDCYLFTDALTLEPDGGTSSVFYLADLLQEMARLKRSENPFEAFRKYADRSLFLTGVFPEVLRKRARSGWANSVSIVDCAYYVSTGKRFYRMAAEHDLADTDQRDTLTKLSSHFEVYLDALNEISERYIMGFDMKLIADKMLDSINTYRETGEERHLLNAGRYAAILKVHPEELSGSAGRQPHLLQGNDANE